MENIGLDRLRSNVGKIQSKFYSRNKNKARGGSEGAELRTQPCLAPWEGRNEAAPKRDRANNRRLPRGKNEFVNGFAHSNYPPAWNRRLWFQPAEIAIEAALVPKPGEMAYLLLPAFTRERRSRAICHSSYLPGSGFTGRQSAPCRSAEVVKVSGYLR